MLVPARIKLLFFVEKILKIFLQKWPLEFPLDRGSLPFEQNGPKEDIDDLRVVVRICPL